MELFFFRDRECDRWHQRVDEEYAAACRYRQHAKGLLLAIHDARTIVKLLCCLPRHPDLEDTIDHRLKSMTFGAASALTKAEAYVASVRVAEGSESVGVKTGSFAGKVGVAAKDAVQPSEAPPPVYPPDGLPDGLIKAGLEEAMRISRRALPAWPSHVHDFVRLAMIAHGAAKALAIRDAFQYYSEALRATHERTCHLVAVLTKLGMATDSRLEALRQRMATSDEAADYDGVHIKGSALASELQTMCNRQLHLTKHSNLLRGVQEANALLLQMVERLRSTAHGPGTVFPVVVAAVGSPLGEQMERLFVAGDGSRGVRSNFVPAEFGALCSLLTAVDGATRALDGNMRAVISAEGWPPPACARRTRVKTDGALDCHRCLRRFSKQWAFSGVCWQCEGEIRTEGTCPFDNAARSTKDGRAAAHHAFCVHQGKCLVCDGGFAPCPVCRLARGDGERCVEICADIAQQPGASECPVTVFLDFDRTLCSTKGGRSPLVGVHSTDAELASLAASHATYIVTRNPHEAEIRAFLSERNVRVTAVCIVPKRASKASVMLDIMPSLAIAESGGVRAIFVDDDVRELARPSVAELPGLLRVLFRRTGL